MWRIISVLALLLAVQGVLTIPTTEENHIRHRHALFRGEEPPLLADEDLYQDEEPAVYNEDQPLYQEEQPVYSHSVEMTSESQHLRVREGEAVSLPCTWESVSLEPDEEVVVLWKKMPSSILFTNRIQMSPNSRLHVTSDNSLEISNITAGDAGTYACTLSLPPRPPQVLHTVSVLLPARLQPNDKEHYKVKEGDKFELVCRAHGFPTPTVSWSKLGDDLAYLQQDPGRGVAVTFDPVQAHHAGTYTCTAQNGIGEPANSVTSLEVIHAPYIAVERQVVRTAKGLEAEVVCKVFANPRAKVRWEWNGEPLPVNPSYETTVSRRFFSLKIRHIQDSDLGNYTCHAENELGRSENHITLTGLPGALELQLSRPEKLENGSYSCQLSWQLVSFAPLERVAVSLRPLQPVGSASVEMQLAVPPTRSVARAGSATLAPLAAEVAYQVRVMANNVYGNTPPAVKQFQISAEGELTIQEESPTLAESVSSAEADRLARVKLTPILLIGILSCFLW